MVLNILILLLTACGLYAHAQQDSATNPLTITGYTEVYYTYDFGKPTDGNRPAFAYSHNRHNEVNLNLAFVKAAYANDRIRGNLALAAGTYMNANYAAEPGVLKNIFEANIGIKVSRKSNLWLDAGIMPSHIGFESAIGKDCWNLSRGILADNSPYFETGAKLTYTSPNEKWVISGLVLNGWQRIQRVAGNSTPAFGHQVTFKPRAGITLNSSSFIGNDRPDSVRQMRYFHNFYGIFQLSPVVGLTVGIDAGAQQKAKGSRQMDAWYAPVVILQVKTGAKTAIALRGEHYNDKHGVIVSTGTPNGFSTWGYSANFDYSVSQNVLWRVEARGFTGKDATFIKNNEANRNNLFLATALAISF
ncbi:MAG: porin [Chitinophagaceae bacterium]|nr:porin [Chitinophagaceae bacterium]